MKKLIKYYLVDSTEKKIVEYTDELLKEIIKMHMVLVPECDQILLVYEELETHMGQVGVYLSNTSDKSIHKKYAAFSLHNINLEIEDWKHCTKECQREKRYIQRHFPKIKCISNFR